MLANWIGDVVGLMHKYGITKHQLADHLGMTREYISMVLNGHRDPIGVEERFRKAVAELVTAKIGLKETNDGKEGRTMAAKEFLTDDQVEKEIERLTASPLVALARREQRLRYKRRQYLYQLRDLEKKGRALEKAGITMEVLNGLCEEESYDEPC